MDLTDEQLAALAYFRLGMTLRLEARAGSGKTSTLRVMGAATSRPGTLVAFNRAVIEDAAKVMPRNVSCSTMHSLAFRHVGRNYGHRLNGNRMRSSDIARLLRLDHLKIKYGTQTKVLQAGYLASLVMRSVNAFCQTGDDEPTERHIPYLDGIDVPDVDGERTWPNNLAVRAHIAPVLGQAWADLQDIDGQLTYTHAHYLKQWERGDPHIPGDFILVDEAQDQSGVMLSILLRQAAQLVAVGDSEQQLYEWLGAHNALAKIPTEATAYLTRSWRFGPAIAEVANLVLRELGADPLVEGCDVDSRVERIDGEPDALLCRSNAEAVRRVLSYQRDSIDVHLVGNAGKQVVSFAEAAQMLQAGAGTTHPELACFNSWKEVVAYVEQDPSGGELALLVGLVEEFGPDVIIEALAHMPGEAAAEVVVSTAHQSKGRQWPTVRLAGDFQDPEGDKGEWRLSYVACTRAQQVLDITECEHLSALVDGTSRGPAGGGAAAAAPPGARSLFALDGQQDEAGVRPDHPDGDTARSS